MKGQRNGILAALAVLIALTSFGQVDFTTTDNCYGQLTTMTSSAAIADSNVTAWDWDLDNDSLFDDATGKSIDNLFGAMDTFTVGLRITHTGGVDSTFKNIIVHATPAVNFNVNNLCFGDTAVFSDASIVLTDSIVEWKWDFDNDGLPDDISSGPVANWIAPPPTTNITRLDVTTNMGCTAFATKATEVFVQPYARFDVDANTTTLGDNTFFMNKSTPATGSAITLYVWDFGDGEQSLSGGNPTHRYEGAGTYIAQLVVMNQNLCVDTFRRTVAIVDEEKQILVKSRVLTPNGDGFNDKFEIRGFAAFGSCDLKIFNMWNDLVVEVSGYTNDWDGTSDDGKELDPGTYFYVITCDGSEPTVGTVNILR